MIPGLTEMAKRFGLNPNYLPMVLVALFTGIVLAVQSIARFFEDRNP